MPFGGGGDGRGDLLAQIRNTGGASALKPAAVRESPPSPPPAAGGASENDLAAALRNALSDRQKALAGSDSDEDEDEDDWDD
ncbi:hypothetical protein HK097_004559 [Rhizophlyctis rosea]|uniref:WH2 domain-containing protein n=1 Tax=Rhizophlyctis rosea TaxID=64517 RepID=A0AAD5S2K2_9FUNG|nr:hypothetical protein HK097_004559 [Rhizophlyctis rosea]